MSEGKLKVLDLFSGIQVGGFSLGLERTGGFETVAFCEIEPFPRKVLAKHWPEVPIFNDVRELRGKDVGPVDVICGGFPCQDASIAKIGGKGTDGERTGLFREIIRLAGELGRPILLLENVTELLNRGFGDVLGALATLGYDVQWDCISAAALGGPHQRDRLFIYADAGGEGWARSFPHDSIFVAAFATLAEHGNDAFAEWAALDGSEPVLRGGNALSVAMERRRISAIGNAVIPRKVELIGNAILAAEHAAQRNTVSSLCRAEFNAR